MATTRRHYVGKDGTRHEYEAHLLRRSYRDGQGKSQKETPANLSRLPASSLDAIRKTLAARLRPPEVRDDQGRYLRERDREIGCGSLPRLAEHDIPVTLVDHGRAHLAF